MSGVTLAWTGASGLQYGVRLLEILLRDREQVHLMISDAARIVAGLEMDLALPKRPAEVARFLGEHLNVATDTLQVYAPEQWSAAVASGSGAPRRMAVCPCTTGTLAAIAGGHSDNLIERAADVILKERGQLILVPRETPLSTLHLRNMLALSEMGAVILPPSPGFYDRPEHVDDLIDFVVARILDHLGHPHSLGPRWGCT